MARATFPLQARPCAGRCPVCREDLVASRLARVRCDGCGVTQHAACVRLVGRCATFGCAGSGLRTAAARAAQRETAPPAEREPARVAEREPAEREPAPPAEREPAPWEPAPPAEREPAPPAEREPAARLWTSVALASLLPLVLALLALFARATHFHIMSCSGPAELVLPAALVSLPLTFIANVVGVRLGLTAAADARSVGRCAAAIAAAAANALPWVAALASA